MNKEKDTVLTVYTDTDWANKKSDSMSSSENLFKLRETPTFSITKSSNCIVILSAEAGFVSAVNAAQEDQ